MSFMMQIEKKLVLHFLNEEVKDYKAFAFSAKNVNDEHAKRRIKRRSRG